MPNRVRCIPCAFHCLFSVFTKSTTEVSRRNGTVFTMWDRSRFFDLRRNSRNGPMSFQAYLDNILAKTGKTPEQLKESAVKAGVYKTDMKASALVDWPKKEYQLGHGHSMAVWAVFKDSGWVESPKKKK